MPPFECVDFLSGLSEEAATEKVVDWNVNAKDRLAPKTCRNWLNGIRVWLKENRVRNIDWESVRDAFRSYVGKVRTLVNRDAITKEQILETSNVLGLELIPDDIQSLIREHDELRRKLKIYEREEALKNELIQQTLEDQAVRSWIRDAENLLLNLMRRGQAGEAILKTSLRMDPEVSFLPEEMETGYTQATNLTYLNQIASRGLLWETRKKGRKAFRNRLYQWVAENIRKIMPSAPDEAVNQIAEHLKNIVVR